MRELEAERRKDARLEKMAGPRRWRHGSRAELGGLDVYLVRLCHRRVLLLCHSADLSDIEAMSAADTFRADVNELLNR